MLKRKLMSINILSVLITILLAVCLGGPVYAEDQPGIILPKNWTAV